MHEEALLRDLHRKVLEVAAAQAATRVRRISLWVGALAHLTEEQLRARWVETFAGTLAEGAQLDIEHSLDPEDPRADKIVLTKMDIDLRHVEGSS